MDEKKRQVVLDTETQVLGEKFGSVQMNQLSDSCGFSLAERAELSGGEKLATQLMSGVSRYGQRHMSM